MTKIVLVGIALLLLCGVVVALETEVCTVEKRTLSIDIGPEYLLTDQSIASDGNTINHDLDIKSTQQAGMISITIINTCGGSFESMPPSDVIEFWQSVLVDLAAEDDDEVVGTWPVAYSATEKATVYEVKTEDFDLNNGTIYEAIWRIEENVYAMMISTMDEITTRRVIETLTLT